MIPSSAPFPSWEVLFFTVFLPHLSSESEKILPLFLSLCGFAFCGVFGFVLQAPNRYGLYIYLWYLWCQKINQTNKKTNKKPQTSLNARAVIRMFVVVLGLNFRENFTIVSYLIQKLQLISSVTVPVQKQLPAWICTLLNLPLVWLLGLVGCTVTFFHLCKAFPVDNSEVQAKKQRRHRSVCKARGKQVCAFRIVQWSALASRKHTAQAANPRVFRNNSVSCRVLDIQVEFIKCIHNPWGHFHDPLLDLVNGAD